MQPSQTYYDVLGVTRCADADLIEKAYRVTAKKYHPDRCSGARERRLFELATAAYETLGDVRLRRLYDRTLLSLDHPRRPRAGVDLCFVLTLRFDQAARGGVYPVRRMANIGPSVVEVLIPPAVEDGAMLYLPEMGLPSPNGGPPGQLVVLVAVEPDSRFRREGLDLYTDVNVPLETALNGGKVKVTTLEGQVEVTVPPGTNGGTRLCSRSLGLKTDQGRYGDLFAIVRLQLPREIREAAKEAASEGRTVSLNGLLDSNPQESETSDIYEGVKQELEAIGAEQEKRQAELDNWHVELVELYRQVEAMREELESGREISGLHPNG